MTISFSMNVRVGVVVPGPTRNPGQDSKNKSAAGESRGPRQCRRRASIQPCRADGGASPPPSRKLRRRTGEGRRRSGCNAARYGLPMACAMNCSISRAGRAPASLAICLPPLKTARVGIDRTLNRPGNFRQLLSVDLRQRNPSGLRRRHLFELRSHHRHVRTTAPRSPRRREAEKTRSARRTLPAMRPQSAPLAGPAASCTCRISPTRRDGRNRRDSSDRTIDIRRSRLGHQLKRP